MRRVRIILYVVMPLSEPLGGSLDVNASVASQTPEDFTAHPEMHPLIHIVHLIRHGATCMSLILRLREELNLQQLHPDTEGVNLQVIPQMTKGMRQHVGCVWIMLYVVTPLSEPLGGILNVNASVTSQTPEDFTAHPEMHSLNHIIHLIRHGATCISLTLFF